MYVCMYVACRRNTYAHSKGKVDTHRCLGGKLSTWTSAADPTAASKTAATKQKRKLRQYSGEASGFMCAHARLETSSVMRRTVFSMTVHAFANAIAPGGPSVS